MADIDWKIVWDNTLKDKELFPMNSVDGKTISVACPTRFSNKGEFAIDITPSFSDNSISLEMLLFNDNISIEDLNKDKSDSTDGALTDYNMLSDKLVDYELSNRLLDRFDIASEGFNSLDEAKEALIDYINNKATESGRMFDDKLDELNDYIKKNKKSEGFNMNLKRIKDSRRNITEKVASILRRNFHWRLAANEDVSDSTTTFYDRNGNLVAVVSLVDDYLIVDLSKTITAKVSVLQSDEDIEDELVSDIDNSQSIIKASKEIEDLKDVVGSNPEGEFNDTYDAALDEDEYMESLYRRVTKLENLYISRKLRRMF